MSSGSSGNKPPYVSPTGRVRYDDAGVTGKSYVTTDSRRSTIGSADLPFGEGFIKKWFGSKKVNPRAPIQVQEGHVTIPVTDENGKRFHAHYFDVKYDAPGPGPAVAKGDGTRARGSMPFMMAPGMVPKPGTSQFPEYSVPPSAMSRKQSDFSYFTPIPDPPKTS